MIANLLAIDIILSDQLDGFGERRDFRVAVLIGRNGCRFRIGGACVPGMKERKTPAARNEVNALKGKLRFINIHVWTQTTRLSFIPLFLPTGWYDKVRIPF